MTAIFLPLILVAATLLRFYNNTAVALWHDEAFSALYIRYPWGEMIYRIGLDVHPPLYYFILRIWTYFAGTSLLSLRTLSIIFGVLTVWATYLFVKAAFQNKKLAPLAALAVAINPFQIQYALEARMYTLGTFLAMLLCYYLARALDASAEKRKSWPFWLGFSITCAAAMYTHYYLFFSIAAAGLYALIFAIKRHKIRPLVLAAISFAASAVLYLPWVPTLLEQIGRVEQSYWIPAMDRWSIPGTVWKMIFGGQGIRHTVLATSSIAAILIVLFFLKRIRNFSKWLVFLQVVIPIVLAIVLSLKTNLYLDRYFVFSSLFFAILVMAAFHSIPNFFARYILVSALVLASLFAFFKNWSDLGIKTKPGMAAASSYVNQAAKPGDSILVGSSFIYFTFKYYNATSIRPLLISTEPVEKIPHFSGTAILTNRDLSLSYDNIKKNQTVWLLWTTGFGGSKPQVPSTWKQINEKGYEDSPGFKGWIIVTQYKVN